MMHFKTLFVSGLLSLAGPSSAALATPDQIVGPGECKECHKNEYNAWSETKHSVNYKELTKLEEAKDITTKLDMSTKDIRKADSICLDCHYTVGLKGKQNPKPRAIAGNSCESCHGPAKGWLVSHQCYRGQSDEECKAIKDVKSTEETDDHKAWRLTEGTVQRGMLRPSDLYAVASNCFGCHTVPNERLVNVGGHTAGSEEFDLVGWSQGEVRHNYFRPPNPDKTVNVESDSARKNLMYVTGAVLDLEHSIRALAAATEDGDYSRAMIKRIQRAQTRLKEIVSAVKIDQIEQILNTAAALTLSHGNGDALNNGADAIAEFGRSFADAFQGRGQDFSAVTGLVPTEYKGEVYQ